MNQSREDNHRKPDYKYYLEEKEELRIQIEECRGPHDCDFQDNQPDTSGYQKTREVALTLATSELQVSTRARQENKHRRAVMRNPASQKKPRRRLGQVERIKQQGSRMNIVARVIEHHDHHHDASQEVN